MKLKKFKKTPMKFKFTHLLLLLVATLTLFTHPTKQQTVFLSESAYSITGPSSTTPIYHVIKLNADKISDLDRDDR
jgi:hypothetical protein